MSRQTLERISPAEYLIRERQAEFKSAYINSEIIPIAGAGFFHLIITGNLFFILKLILRESPHFIFQNEMRVRGGLN